MPVTPGGRGLGLIPDQHDPRDRLYAATGPVPYAFVDLELDPATPPVWDQGQLGSCTAHGTLACFLWASGKCGADDPMLSRLMLYWITRNMEGTADQDSGAQIRDAVKATTFGVAPEDLWPYDIEKFTVEPPREVREAGLANVGIDYQRVDGSTGSIQACLSDGFPIDIGVVLYPSFEADEALHTGSVPMPGDGEQSIGGHCMAVWGIGTGADWQSRGQFLDAQLSPTKTYVKVRNSWGSGVYQRGYLLMPLDYLTSPDLGSDYWTIRRVS